MQIKSATINLNTKGHSDVVDITERVASALNSTGLKNGLVNLFVIGSTAGLTTIEYEPGLVHDIKVAFEKLAPKDGHYQHHERWNDDNGHSHIRASLLGPSLSIPVIDKKLTLGTWQQIILIDFDTRGRQREIVVQVFGE